MGHTVIELAKHNPEINVLVNKVPVCAGEVFFSLDRYLLMCDGGFR
jgi:hypothetical protein